MSVAYAERTFLPFLRRAARTLRPFFELMRARKPWTLLRLRVFGWNVRFILETPPALSVNNLTVLNSIKSSAYIVNLFLTDCF